VLKNNKNTLLQNSKNALLQNSKNALLQNSKNALLQIVYEIKSAKNFSNYSNLLKIGIALIFFLY
jgi:hypothetical protein